jgi:hypothetical protein
MMYMRYAVSLRRHIQIRILKPWFSLRHYIIKQRVYFLFSFFFFSLTVLSTDKFIIFSFLRSHTCFQRSHGMCVHFSYFVLHILIFDDTETTTSILCSIYSFSTVYRLFCLVSSFALQHSFFLRC